MSNINQLPKNKAFLTIASRAELNALINWYLID